MPRPLGRKQIELMRGLASPGMFLVIGNPVVESLCRRGFAKCHDPERGAMYQITPAGMRHLADEWEAGRIDFPKPQPRK